MNANENTVKEVQYAMTAPKLTEAQRACLEYVAEGDFRVTVPGLDEGVEELIAKGLVSSAERLTDAGRAALRGE